MPIVKRKSFKSCVGKLCLAASAYYIWNERNSRLFKKSKRSVLEVVDCIMSSVRLKLLTCRFKKSKDAVMFSRVWELPLSNLKSVKSKKKQEWKPTGHVFTHFGYRWIPIRRTFIIDGNKCPLTRFTSTTVVLPKKPVSAKVVKKIPPSSKNLGKPNATNVSSSSKSKNVDSKISNNSEPKKLRDPMFPLLHLLPMSI
ncbi:hypothetical protein Tco_0683505 [Tanacetum coccineum]|uniref:Reverse transcriptase domain, Reverse transcriptase zinc-binding domain protein n=1 Tax=Tanacetum coccineum TaxID=301880 RepID=A0ABQ4XU47_9ASTR